MDSLTLGSMLSKLSIIVSWDILLPTECSVTCFTAGADSSEHTLNGLAASGSPTLSHSLLPLSLTIELWLIKLRSLSCCFLFSIHHDSGLNYRLCFSRWHLTITQCVVYCDIIGFLIISDPFRKGMAVSS